VADETGYCLDWLLAGRGPKRRNEARQDAVGDDERSYDLAEAEVQLTEFRSWLDDYFHGASLKVRWWILGQLRRCLEDYDQYLSAEQDGRDQ